MTEAARFDLVLADGLVVDGTGELGFVADIGILDDRIAGIGRLERHSAARRVDCRGKVVAPGFIDTHTHDDTALMLWPDLPQKTSQGVTSVIIGARRLDQLNDNLGATEVTLGADDLSLLGEVSALAREYPGWMFERQQANSR